MKRFFLFLSLLVFIPSAALKAEEISLTLEEAIVIALRDNRAVLLKSEDVKKAKEKIAEAKASLFPALNFTGSQTLTKGYYSKDSTQTTVQATLKQYLYKGGKTINAIEENKYKLEVSHALLDKIKLETILNAKKAFYTLLLARDFAHLNKDIMHNTRAHLEVIEMRYRVGQASRSDILTMRESLGRVEEAYEASLNQGEAAQALLRNLLHLDEAVKINPTGQFVYEPKEVAYDEAFLKAIATRPEIRQYEAQSKADRKAVEIAKADKRPDIYASWDYYSRSHTSATAQKNWNDYNVIGVTFSWPLFDGWATKAKVEQAIIDLKETRLAKEKLIKDIALELRNAYLELKNAIAKMKAAEAEGKVYSDNLASVRQKYQQGVTSFLDINDANLQYGISMFNKKQAVYDYIIAKSSFDKATGGI